MSKPTSFIHLVFSLPAADFSIYTEATQRLRGIMGKAAPDVLLLMVHTLRCRDAHGLVEDYLESIDWPVAPRKPTALQSGRQTRLCPRSGSGKRQSLSAAARGDPARN